MMQSTDKPAILFVCTANIIRSPIAEALFRRILQRFYSLEGWQVGSAGVLAFAGFPADQNAITVVRGLGIDLSQHTAHQVSPELLDQYDVVLTMEKNQKEALANNYLDQAFKIHFIGELTGDWTDIYDPRNESLQDYLTAARNIETILEKKYLRILMAALVNSLKRIGLPSPNFQIFSSYQSLEERTSKTDAPDDFEWMFRQIISLPLEDQYDLLLVLHLVKPDNIDVLLELQHVAELISPPDYESRWLKDIFYHEIVLPVTCMQKMSQRQFVHPAIQDELEQLAMRLNDPNCNQLFLDLEKLFHRKLSEQKYLFNIWDLRVKYKALPHNDIEYDEAYRILHQKYHAKEGQD
jgi:protein-tyrosine-phosphatase